MSRLPSVLTFDGAELRVIDHDGQPWITGTDLSRALGYSRRDHVSRIYRDNQDEFTDSMTQVITLQTSKLNENTESVFSGNLPSRVRIFSPRGAHLIAMFARTKNAAAFRRWVLDVLEGLTNAPVPAAVATAPEASCAAGSIAALIADNMPGPALVEIPAIMNACAQRLSGAMCVPSWTSAPAPSEVADYVRDTYGLKPSQLEAIAIAALQRVRRSRGEKGIREVLAKVDDDWLLASTYQLQVAENLLALELSGRPSREVRK